MASGRWKHGFEKSSRDIYTSLACYLIIPARALRYHAQKIHKRYPAYDVSRSRCSCSQYLSSSWPVCYHPLCTAYEASLALKFSIHTQIAWFLSCIPVLHALRPVSGFLCFPC